jgi:hypothetical protein
VRSWGNCIVDFVVSSGRHCWSLTVVVPVHSAVLTQFILTATEIGDDATSVDTNWHKTEFRCLNTSAVKHNTHLSCILFPVLCTYVWSISLRCI